jgi:SAM-dependent methyltransferase
MTRIPDLNDPRYLDEIGWFLYHEKYGRDQFGGTYDAERLAYSQLLLNEVLSYLDRDLQWLEKDKTVVSIGCGCTGDLAAFPAAVKIAIDPLLGVYQKLKMLVADEVGNPTVYLSMGADNLPLVDDSVDLVICRNALDHMPVPGTAVREIWRVLKKDGALFLSVDIGGDPTPDEPTVFSVESLRGLLRDDFEIATLTDNESPHSAGRLCSVRLLARKKLRSILPLDKEAILQAYESRVLSERERNPVGENGCG